MTEKAASRPISSERVLIEIQNKLELDLQLIDRINLARRIRRTLAFYTAVGLLAKSREFHPVRKTIFFTYQLAPK